MSDGPASWPSDTRLSACRHTIRRSQSGIDTSIHDPSGPGRFRRSAAPRRADFLCFAVYSANQAFGKAYKPKLDALGLTYTQYITLVAASEGEAQTVGPLGERLYLESNTLTPILRKLEALGYLARQRAQHDERQVLISLTPQGWQLRETLGKLSLADASGLSAEAFDATRQAVARLRDRLVASVRDSG